MADFPSQGCIDLLVHLEQTGADFQDFAKSVGRGIGPDFLAHLVRGRKRPSIQTAGDIERATKGAVLAASWSVKVPASQVKRALASAKGAKAEARRAETQKPSPLPS